MAEVSHLSRVGASVWFNYRGRGYAIDFLRYDEAQEFNEGFHHLCIYAPTRFESPDGTLLKISQVQIIDKKFYDYRNL